MDLADGGCEDAIEVAFSRLDVTGVERVVPKSQVRFEQVSTRRVDLDQFLVRLAHLVEVAELPIFMRAQKEILIVPRERRELAKHAPVGADGEVLQESSLRRLDRLHLLAGLGFLAL